MLQSLAILGSDGHDALDGLAVHVQRDTLAAVFVELDIDGLALIEIFKNNVDIDRGGEEEGRHGASPRVG
jgi:hypothetical protein